MSWSLKSKRENIGKETIKLRTECLIKNNIFEGRPSNGENAYLFYENAPKHTKDN